MTIEALNALKGIGKENKVFGESIGVSEEAMHEIKKELHVINMNGVDARLFSSAREAFAQPLALFWLSRGMNPKAIRVNDNETNCFVLYLGTVNGKYRYID